MATTTDAPDIVRGEDRKFRVNFGAAQFPTGAASWAFSLVLTQTKGGAAVVTKTFGAADYTTEEWEFTIPASGAGLGTSELTFGRVTYGTVRRTDSGFNQVLLTFTCTVG